MAQIREKFILLVAMATGYLPSFALPFVIAHVTSAPTSDAILLGVSTAITVGSVLSIAYENAWSASVAKLLASGSTLKLSTIHQGLRQAAAIGSVVTLVLLPLYGLSYFIKSDNSRELLLICLVAVGPFPIVSAIASVYAGALIAHGRVAVTIALQATRGIFPVTGGALLLLGLPAPTIGILLSAGELVRLILLAVVLRRSVRPASPSQGRSSGWNGPRQGSRGVEHMPTPRSILHHIGGLAAMGVSPIIDRAFLGATYIGAITRFEMADRIFTAFSQIANNLLVTPRVPNIAHSIISIGVPATTSAETRRTVLRGTIIAVIAAIPIAIIVTFSRGYLSEVLLWALLLLVSLPAAAAGTLGTRLLVAANKSRAIPGLAVVGVTTNTLGNVIGVATTGATGVLMSTVVCRYVLLFVTFAILHSSPRSAERAAEV